MHYDIRADFLIHHQVVNSSGTPVVPDAAPTFRVYGESGLIDSGTASKQLTGVVSNVTNANPAVITDTDHGLTTGTMVTVSGVGGATGVNGTRVVTKIDADNFSVPVAAGGAYTSGGVWEVTGLYVCEFDSSLRAQLEVGRSYAVVIDYEISSVHKTEVVRFVAT